MPVADVVVVQVPPAERHRLKLDAMLRRRRYSITTQSDFAQAQTPLNMHKVFFKKTLSDLALLIRVRRMARSAFRQFLKDLLHNTL